MATSKFNIFYLIGMICIMMAGCVEPYTPPESNNPNLDVLVVDGFINATTNTATVNLTKAVPLNSETTRVPVNQALVKIISEDGNEFVLGEMLTSSGQPTGIYANESLVLDLDKKYKLRIERDINKIYESEFVPVLEAPEIEKVYFDPQEDGLKVFVDSKEDPDKSRYFQWKYQETWRYNAPYSSLYEYVNGAVQFREEDIYICYKGDVTSPIEIGTTNNLSQNVVKNKQVCTVDRNSIKLASVYSINVQQFSLTEEAYTYWYNVDRMTENMGGLFDPMPGQVGGNIKNLVDPSEPVIGFFSASSVQEQREFISVWDLPPGYSKYRATACQVDTIKVENISMIPENNLLIGSVTEPNGTQVIGYTMADRGCVDCRLYGGGTTVKPDYWP